MSVYPPLTEANLAEINRALEHIRLLREEVANTVLCIVMAPGDEDELYLEIGQFRGRVQALDLALFQMFGLIGRLQRSNVPTTLPPPKPRAQTLSTDVLEDLLK
jgi:hypothetical protein